MNDPHIEALSYRVNCSPTVDYRNAPPLREETDIFILEINDDQATFHMKVHCSTEGEARGIVDEYINRWHVLIDLEHGFEALRLTYSDSRIVDRNPLPEPTGAGDLKIEVHDAIHVSSVVSLNLHTSFGSYPSRPGGFRVSPDVETMSIRYKGYKEGREPLLSMASLCLTVLEASTRARASQRSQAVKKYSIDLAVLKTLGDLCANRGDPQEARKAPHDGIFKPLSAVEREWIEQVVKAMIRRAGEYAYNPDGKFREIGMTDLPPL